MIDALRAFLAVATHQRFGVAARHLHLSQPALSAVIAKLEAELGARVFDRGRHGAQLTAAGAALVPHAHAALAAVEDGRRAVREIGELGAGEVRLGGGATAVTYLLPSLLAQFRRRYRNLRYQLREGFTADLELAVDRGDIDLAIITMSKGGSGLIDRWLDDELIVVASPTLDAKHAGWITFTDGSPTRALLLRHVPAADITMELGSIAAVKGNARAGMGLALVSRAAVKTDLANGHLIEVRRSFSPVRRRLGLRHRGVHRLPPAAAALRQHLLAQ